MSVHVLITMALVPWTPPPCWPLQSDFPFLLHTLTIDPFYCFIETMEMFSVPLSLAPQMTMWYLKFYHFQCLHEQGAEINSRTGSKLGISPLMLAAMNGHAATVKLLLDMGSDINAQIETNRNTALTLACFQGRCEVVSLLLDRKANVEHRAKTGLTPLMEAASGGYVEVGRILLDKGADVNAPPVPSSRDTALTIAADKGHYRFVELLIKR